MSSNKVIIKTTSPRQEKSSYYFQEINLYEPAAEVARIYFKTDDSTLNQDDEEVLDFVAEIFNFVGETHEIYLGCQAYTDQRGSFEYNQRLASKRSGAVSNCLQSKITSKNVKVLPYTGFRLIGLNYAKYRFVGVWIRYIWEITEIPEKVKRQLRKAIEEAEQGIRNVTWQMAKNPNKTSKLLELYMKHYRVHDLLGLDENLIAIAEMTIDKYLKVEIENQLKLMIELPYSEENLKKLTRLLQIVCIHPIEDDSIIQKANEVLNRGRKSKNSMF